MFKDMNTYMTLNEGNIYLISLMQKKKIFQLKVELFIEFLLCICCQGFDPQRGVLSVVLRVSTANGRKLQLWLRYTYMRRHAKFPSTDGIIIIGLLTSLPHLPVGQTAVILGLVNTRNVILFNIACRNTLHTQEKPQ